MTLSEHHGLLMDTVERMLEQGCTPELVQASEGQMAWSLWQTFEEAGLPLMAVRASSGGGGVSLYDAFCVLERAAAYAAPIPLAETGLLAGFALDEAELEVPAGPLACVWATGGNALSIERSGRSWTVSGTAGAVPYASTAHRLVVVAPTLDRSVVALVDPAVVRISRATNLAGEPRDDLIFDRAAVADDAIGVALTSAAPDVLELRAALCRAVQLAGALRRATELTVDYARERVQFGRPIARFQIVQQMLAELAGEAAEAKAATQLAIDAASSVGLPDAAWEVAVAKLRTSDAAGRAARIAHQVHGAIGTTREHRLHHTTRRLWAWRDEHGSEAVWGAWLGAQAVCAGADQLWPRLAQTRS
jgi:acyl-CoA dehydrogenase